MNLVRVGEMGVGKTGQIIGETGVGEMVPFFSSRTLFIYLFGGLVPNIESGSRQWPLLSILLSTEMST